MLFTDFLESIGNPPNSKIASILGCSGESVRLYKLGRMPRPKILDKIEKLSDGQVTAIDFKNAYLQKSTTN